MKNFLRFACFASLAFAAFLSHAETYAVMVGICDYPDVADKDGNPIRNEKGEVLNNDLSGCVNDVKSYKDILTGKYGVKPANIKMILDKDANQANFIDGMKWMIQSAKPGDQVMFFYSGHGTQFDSKEEEDGKQEAIVLADMTLVDGSFFKELSHMLAKNGLNATFVFDSCFSGGLTREGGLTLDGKAYTPHQRFIQKDALGAKAKAFSATNEKNLKAMAKAKGAKAAEGTYAFVMGGGENQTTIDLNFKDADTPDHGLFTLVFATLVEKLPDAPLEEVMKAIADYLKEKKFDQSPTYEFSSEDRGHKPFFLKD